MPRRKYAWETLSDEQLLKRRLSSLRVTVEGTWLEDCVSSLHEELEERGIRLRPHAWISSEWFSPDSTPGIAIPFYLAHPRLMKLEKKMMLDVEGGTLSECMAILRHEAGHTMQHAYQLQRRRGKKHHAAVRALAFKWIRVIYRCWKERVAYDESVYLGALAKHNSPLVATTKAV